MKGKRITTTIKGGATVRVKGEVKTVAAVVAVDAGVGGVTVDEAMEMLLVNATTVVNGVISHTTAIYREGGAWEAASDMSNTE